MTARLLVLLAALVLVCAAPSGVSVAADPATTPLTLKHLKVAQRKLLIDRAKNFYKLPDGSIWDFDGDAAMRAAFAEAEDAPKKGKPASSKPATVEQVAALERVSAGYWGDGTTRTWASTKNGVMAAKRDWYVHRPIYLNTLRGTSKHTPVATIKEIHGEEAIGHLKCPGSGSMNRDAVRIRGDWRQGLAGKDLEGEFLFISDDEREAELKGGNGRPYIAIAKPLPRLSPEELLQAIVAGDAEVVVWTYEDVTPAPKKGEPESDKRALVWTRTVVQIP